MKNSTKISWLNTPEEHDYPAAENYLSLIFPKNIAHQYCEALKNEVISYFKAKDIFRASKLSLLWISNFHVRKDSKRIEQGKPLSPLLLIRDPKTSCVIVADWYHRLCAVYEFDEDAIIPCKITG